MWEPDVSVIPKNNFSETTIDNMTTAMKNVLENDKIKNDISEFLRDKEEIEEKIQAFIKNFNNILNVMKRKKTLAGRCDYCPGCMDLFS